MNTITVNGRVHEVEESQLTKKLLNYIREDLELTGTKNGCNVGACGSCMVLIDNVAKKSCVVSMEKAIGKTITTIEGVENSDGTLHPLQQAFIDAGAVQCGFCTPGMIMKGLDLLGKNPDPDRDEIRKAFNGNLCRCTGYQQIVDAVQLYVKREK